MFNSFVIIPWIALTKNHTYLYHNQNTSVKFFMRFLMSHFNYLVQLSTTITVYNIHIRPKFPIQTTQIPNSFPLHAVSTRSPLYFSEEIHKSSVLTTPSLHPLQPPFTRKRHTANRLLFLLSRVSYVNMQMTLSHLGYKFRPVELSP